MLQFALAKSSPFNFLVVPPSCVPCVSSSSFASSSSSRRTSYPRRNNRSASLLPDSGPLVNILQQCRARPPPLRPWLGALPGAELAEGTREALTWAPSFPRDERFLHPRGAKSSSAAAAVRHRGGREGGGEEGARQGFPTASGSSQSKPLNHWEVKAIGGSLSAAHFKTAEFCGIFCVFVFLRWPRLPPPQPTHPKNF